MLGTYHLNALFDILRELHFIYDPAKLWDFVLEKASQTVQAEAGTFFEMSADEAFLKVGASYGMDKNRLGEVPFRVGSGICGWVAQYKQPALVNDVRQDNRFNKGVDILTGFNTRSILCVPVFTSNRQYGVLEALNRKSGPFSPQDQEFMTILGRQTAIAYQNLLLIAEVSHSKILLESLVGSLTGGLVAMNASEAVTIINPAAVRMLKLESKPQTGKPMKDVLKDHPWFVEILKQTLTSKQTVSRQEASLTVGGETFKLGYTTILISSPEGLVMGSGIIFQKLAS